MTKYLELAKKLKLLADQGHGGEKENANEMLLRIMRDHNITMDQIEDPARDYVVFKVLNLIDAKFIFSQTAMSVIGQNADIRFFKSTKTNKYLKMLVMATHAEGVEIRAKYEFFYKAFLEEMKLFRHAFVQKNDLLPPDGGTATLATMTLEQRQAALAMAELAEGIGRHNFNKQIGSEPENIDDET